MHILTYNITISGVVAIEVQAKSVSIAVDILEPRRNITNLDILTSCIFLPEYSTETGHVLGSLFDWMFLLLEHSGVANKGQAST